MFDPHVTHVQPICNTTHDSYVIHLWPFCNLPCDPCAAHSWLIETHLWQIFNPFCDSYMALWLMRDLSVNLIYNEILNVIVVILQTSGTTYRNSCKAYVFCRSRYIQRALNHFCMWNTTKICTIWQTKIRWPLPDVCCRDWKEAIEAYHIAMTSTWMCRGMRDERDRILRVCIGEMLGHIRWTWPELVEWWILHHDNAHPHMAHFVQEWLEWHVIEVTVPPVYSPDLTPGNFWLFPTLKRGLRSWSKSRKVWLTYPRSNFAKRLKKNGSKGWNSILEVREDTLKRMVAIRMIPNAKMMICNHFQRSFSFLTFSRPFFGRGWRTFVYKIIHISACISSTEVIEHS